MERIALPLIADAILAAPGWARVGITSPKSSMREDAAMELAKCIASAWNASDTAPMPVFNQPRLAL